MSERVTIPNHRGGAGWFIYEDGRGPHPHLICGGCARSEHAGRLVNHTPPSGGRPDGTVHASILCPHPNCGWHVWGQLDNWTHGLKPPGQSIGGGQ